MKPIFALFFLLFIVGCGSGEAPVDGDNLSDFTPAEIAEQSSAYEQMMDVHNRVMPKMGELTQLQRGLFETLETEGIEKARYDAYKSAYDGLETANDNMMEWMRNVKSMDEIRALDGQDAILEYIQTEENKMVVLEEQMEAGMAAAKALLGQEISKD